MKRLIVMLIFIMKTSLLYAGSSTNEQTLNYFRTGKQSHILVLVGGESGFSSDEGCTSDKAALDPNTNNAKEMYSQLLAAYMANKKVKFYGNGCIGDGPNQFIKIEFVYFAD